MAVQIYYQSIHDIVINEQLLSALQPGRRKQLFSLRFEADKKRCAAAGMLLWEHLYHRHPECFTVSYSASGKPSVAYCSDPRSQSDFCQGASSSDVSLSNPSFSASSTNLSTPAVPFFNLSHSGDFVMLAISDTPIGCDIERLHKAILSRHVFHPNELSLLLSQPEGTARNQAFLRLWTAKEAFLKAIGTGIDANATLYDLSSQNRICLPDGSVWAIEHHPLPDSIKSSCETSSEHFSEYLSCVCYKCLQ